MLKVLIATTNPGKFKEMQLVLDHLPLRILSLTDLNIDLDPEEHGATFAENALIKAKAYYEVLPDQLPVIAEDSGIIVDALGDQLGVQTRRWGAGAQASDQEWIDHFLDRMTDFPEPDQRRAHFVSHAVVYAPHILPQPISVQRRTSGTITPDLEAEIEPGVPLSACFKPDGFDQVYSALPTATKNKISHRGKAMQALISKFI